MKSSTLKNIQMVTTHHPPVERNNHTRRESTRKPRAASSIVRGLRRVAVRSAMRAVCRICRRRPQQLEEEASAGMRRREQQDARAASSRKRTPQPYKKMAPHASTTFQAKAYVAKPCYIGQYASSSHAAIFGESERTAQAG